MADLTVAQFRNDFPEFTDTVAYPNAQANFRLSLGQALLPANVWGAQWNFAVELYMAHNLVLYAVANKTVAIGGIPGLVKGNVSSESPGSVSVSYDTTVSSEEGAGRWNQTTYGQELYSLMMLFGAAPTQVSPGIPFGPGYGTPWFGPPVY